MKRREEFHGDHGCKLGCYGTGYCKYCIGDGVRGSEDPCSFCGGDGMCPCARRRLQREMAQNCETWSLRGAM